MEADTDINEAERMALIIGELADRARAAGFPVIAHLLDMAQMEARDNAIREMDAALPSLN
ncbi:hypothetical protein IZ6_05340 [Terrihabitans soli]|uniref:Uncharacterized protein n=2 Tax=Terrihabitans soli TaxID=708113 RepID=A0A6S6QLN3_9HYPH|nr:hypothetical protein IZ6_05340 [Terrihabitans soli]